MLKTFKYRLFPRKSDITRLQKTLDICRLVYNTTIDLRRIHDRIKNRRDDFCHQTANRLVHRYDFMAVEDLNIKGMLEQKKYSKSIADVSWAQLLQRLSCKAEEAGKTVVAVDPRNTSQMCSRCLTLVPKDISVRVHSCPVCGLKMDQDLNASFNILRLGMQSVEYSDFAKAVSLVTS